MLLAVLNPGLVRLIILFLPPLILVKVFIPLNISSLVLQLPFLVLLLLLVLKFPVKVAGHLYPSVLLVILLLLVLSVLWVLIGAVQHVLVVLSALPLPQPSLLLRALQLLVNLGTLLVQLLHRTEDVDGDLAEHLDDDGGELVEAEER